jgi:hypothetical protein
MESEDEYVFINWRTDGLRLLLLESKLLQISWVLS